jgi:formylmethanofuran dehydrogenase subunit E
VHGGFGSFLPVGVRIGEDAMKRLNAKPRELTVTFYQGEGTPCPCSADGIMLAVSASPGQGTLHIAADKAPPGAIAVAIVKPQGRRRPEVHGADVADAEAWPDQRNNPRSARPLRRGDGH